MSPPRDPLEVRIETRPESWDEDVPLAILTSPDDVKELLDMMSTVPLDDWRELPLIIATEPPARAQRGLRARAKCVAKAMKL